MYEEDGQEWLDLNFKVQECATGTPYPSGHSRHGCARGSTNVGTYLSTCILDAKA